jgi:hypothetical protein
MLVHNVGGNLATSSLTSRTRHNPVFSSNCSRDRRQSNMMNPSRNPENDTLVRGMMVPSDGSYAWSLRTVAVVMNHGGSSIHMLSSFSQPLRSIYSKRYRSHWRCCCPVYLKWKTDEDERIARLSSVSTLKMSHRQVSLWIDFLPRCGGS